MTAERIIFSKQASKQASKQGIALLFCVSVSRSLYVEKAHDCPFSGAACAFLA